MNFITKTLLPCLIASLIGIGIVKLGIYAGERFYQHKVNSYVPKFQAGDCALMERDVNCEKNKEEWQSCNITHYYKVKKIGKTHYLTATVYTDFESESTDSIHSFDDIMVKANCPRHSQ